MMGPEFALTPCAFLTHFQGLPEPVQHPTLCCAEPQDRTAPRAAATLMLEWLQGLCRLPPGARLPRSAKEWLAPPLASCLPSYTAATHNVHLCAGGVLAMTDDHADTAAALESMTI